MSGMDRLADEALERRANTVLSGLGPVHGKLMTEGYEGSANAVMDAADVIRELLAHRRAPQAAPDPSDGLREENERLRALVMRAQTMLDPCYPRDNWQWQEEARAALTPAPAQEGAGQ